MIAAQTTLQSRHELFFDFGGKNVFIFGGASGINLGIAESFAAAGAKLGVASRKQDKVNAAVARLSSPVA